MSEGVSITLGYLPGPLGWVLLALALVAVLYEAWTAVRGDARLPGGLRVRAAIVALRVLALLTLMALLLELNLRLESPAAESRRVVVLVDASASMALADAPAAGSGGVPPTRRIDRAASTWRDSVAARTAWTAQGLELAPHAFDTELRRIDGRGDEALTIEARGAASDLAGALSTLSSEEAGHPLGAVVVFSDGIVAADDAARERLLELAADLGVPVTTVAAGAPVIKDVAVANPRAGEFAFVENVMEIEAEIVAHGLEDTQVPVELRRDGVVLATQPLTLGADGIPRPVRFEVVPELVGQFVYEVRVPELEGEATGDNNRRAFVVKVLRDKVRVLHVAGRPDWDVRALRTLLRRDPNVELLSYYILRDAEDIERSDVEAELSLIAFPVDELFRDKLGSFDLLILHNFDARSHGSYLGNIATYIREGGSVVVIGGDMGLASGDYAPLVGLMPTEVRRPAPLVDDPVRPQLTQTGRRHPITRWITQGEEDEGWSELPPLDTYNEVDAAPRDPDLEVAVLLRHPAALDRSGEGIPVLSVAEVGRGRTMVLATGSSWRLGFAAGLPLIDGARPYDLLWLGAMRWLLRERGDERLVLESDRVRYRPEQPIVLRVETLSTSYAPEAGVEVSWAVRRLDADPTAPPVSQGSLTSDGLGQAVARLEPLAPGDYEASARREDLQAPSAGEDDRTRRVFRVEVESRELERVDAGPGTELLGELARRSGGRALSAARGDRLPTDLPLGRDARRPAEVGTQRDLPLWSSPWILLPLLLGLPGEWWLRRRYGRR